MLVHIENCIKSVIYLSLLASREYEYYCTQGLLVKHNGHWSVIRVVSLESHTGLNLHATYNSPIIGAENMPYHDILRGN